MLTSEDKVVMEVAIDLIKGLLDATLDDNNHVAAAMLGAVIDGLKDIKDR